MTVENILVSDHDDLDQLLAEALRASDRDDPGQAFLSVDLFWARLAMHIRAEHLHVFPALLGTSGSPDFQILIAELKKDHDFFMRELAGIIKSLRNIDDASKNISAELKSRLVMIAERLAAHNESEERVIYPTAAQLESAQLISMVEKELKNMPPRFSKAE